MLLFVCVLFSVPCWLVVVGVCWLVFDVCRCPFAFLYCSLLVGVVIR